MLRVILLVAVMEIRRRFFRHAGNIPSRSTCHYHLWIVSLTSFSAIIVYEERSIAINRKIKNYFFNKRALLGMNGKLIRACDNTRVETCFEFCGVEKVGVYPSRLQASITRRMELTYLLKTHV